MPRRFALLLVPVVFVLSLFVLGVAGLHGVAQAQATILYESHPDVAVLYQGNMAYLRDEVTLPAGEDARILLPATTLAQSLIITEGGERVRYYRFISASATANVPTTSSYLSAAPIPDVGGQRLLVTWDAPAGDDPRAIVLEYLATGAGWTPVYDMIVLDEEHVLFGFDAEIRNTALVLDETDLQLAAGMPGAELGYQPDMTATQMNVGYADVPADVPGGPVEITHVYAIGPQTLRGGDVLRWNLVHETLDARRLLVWDARFGQRTDVIYKVQNTTDIPFVEGTVRAYEDGLYIGDDRLEWTPGGSEGSVTVAGLSDIRARRTESVTETTTAYDYRHDVRLDITNHSGEDVDLIVLDEWNPHGIDFTFSHEPERQGNNVLRWELTIPAGEQVVITYTFHTD